MISVDILRQSRSNTVKNIAARYGFDDCRIAQSAELTDEARDLEVWLRQSRHGDMGYMERHFDLRINPAKLVEGARSVIVLSKNYFPSNELHFGKLKLSKYAYGRDYHKTIRNDLKCMLAELRDTFGNIQGRGFVDSAPVMEKAWAVKSGLGWMGKHTNVLTKSKGSFYFIAVLITDLDLWPDEPVGDHCGTCTRCIDACPTQAIVAPYQLDATRCISYLTIEFKKEIPETYKPTMEGWFFGCDICQDVCPWNRFSTAHREKDFFPRERLMQMRDADWVELSEEQFEDLFSGSAVKRAGYEGLMRNIRFVSSP
ncbi:MAG: tRNA epoxyqueuosine(34) reductase QueG [Salibacteraceae bacterium]